jgi:hypothetical protein
MDFKTFFFNKTVAERDEFAALAGTSRGLLTQVAYGNKRVELGFADVIVALSGGSVELDGIALTDNATRQRQIRQAIRRRGRQSAIRVASAPKVA